MDTLQFLGSALGLGLLSGFRLYATVLALGVAIRMGWFYPTTGQETLILLTDPVVMIAAGALCLIELVADKIPWVDSIWDALHTLIRPAGAALLAAAALGPMDPAVKLACILLCGGVALTSHTAKASLRVAVNHSPEPFTNIGLSTLEDLAVPAGVWVAMAHPFLALAFTAAFVAVFAVLFARVFRLFRIELLAFRGLLGRGRGPAAADLPVSVQPAARDALAVVAGGRAVMPEALARAVAPGRTLGGIRCAAAQKVIGMRHSTGYLTMVDRELVFVARRLFFERVHRMPLSDIEAAWWGSGLLINRLTLRMSNGEQTVFHVFKDVAVPRGIAKGAAS